MSRRKHISWKTKCAAATQELDYVRNQLAIVRGTPYSRIPYNDAKLMTEDQYLSLWHWDHNKLHSFDGGDHFSNLAPMPIKAHREKTKQDAKIIAKSRRIRAKNAAAEAPALRTGPGEFQRHAAHGAQGAAAPRPARLAAVIRVWKRNGPFMQKRKLQSRGFDKRLKRKIDGTTVKR